MKLGVDGVLCGHPPLLAYLSLSTCDPPYEQGLITVVVVASWLHRPVIVIIVIF